MHLVNWLFIYLFLAALCLRHRAWASSSLSEQGLLPTCGAGLLLWLLLSRVGGSRAGGPRQLQGMGWHWQRELGGRAGAWFPCRVLSGLTLCDPEDYSPRGSSAHGILQARTLEWVTISSSRGSSPPRDQPRSLASPALADGFFTTKPLGKPLQHVDSSRTRERTRAPALAGRSLTTGSPRRFLNYSLTDNIPTNRTSGSYGDSILFF